MSTSEFSQALAPQFDTGPLSWVIGEIGDALERSKNALMDAAAKLGEAQSTPLQHAQTHLHQAHGALLMVDVEGASLMTQAAEEALARFKGGALECNVANAQIVANAYQALVEYMEELLTGALPQPARLFPYYRALQMLLGASRIHPADLFFTNLSGQLDTRAQDGPPPNYVACRRRFEKALLPFLKSTDKDVQRTHAAEMQDAIGDVSAAQADPQARTFWFAMQTFAELVATGQRDSDLYVKQLFGLINFQLRRLAQGMASLPEGMLRDALFFIAAAAAPTSGAQRLRKAFRLDGIVPADYEKQRYGQVDAAALGAAKDALVHAKSSWSRLASEHDPELEAGFEASLDTLLDASTRLGVNALTQLLQDLTRVATASMMFGRSEQLGMEVATALLFVGHGLDQIRRLPDEFDTHAGVIGARLLALGAGETPPDATPWQGELSRQIEQAQTVAVLAAEMKTGLRHVEKVLDDYYADPAKRATLSQIEPVLHQLEGALAILDQDDAKLAAEHVREAVRALVTAEGKPDQEASSLQDIAQNVGALGFFIDMLAQNFDAAKHRFRFDTNDGLLRAVPFEKLNVTEAPIVEPEATAPVSSEAPVVAEPEPAVPAVTPEASQSALDTDAGIEAELLEIFIMEAQEVLEFVSATIPAARQDRASQETLTMLRRSFHTLKGSGRMVGLTQFADAGAAIERVMNLWLSEARSANDDLLGLLDRATADMTAWVAELIEKGHSARTSDVLVAAAGRMLDGGAFHIEPEQAAEVIDITALDAPHEPEQLETSEEALAAPLQSHGNVIEFPSSAPRLVPPEHNTRRIGELEIAVPLYNIYLAETDELVRLLQQDFSEWRHEPQRPVSNAALHAAHTLTGTSGTVGFKTLCELAHALEMALLAMAPPAPALDAEQHDVIEAVLERIRQMLTSFAQGDLAGAQPEMVAQLHALSEYMMRQCPPSHDDEEPADDEHLNLLFAETLTSIHIDDAAAPPAASAAADDAIEAELDEALSVDAEQLSESAPHEAVPASADEAIEAALDASLSADAASDASLDQLLPAEADAQADAALEEARSVIADAAEAAPDQAPSVSADEATEAALDEALSDAVDQALNAAMEEARAAEADAHAVEAAELSSGAPADEHGELAPEELTDVIDHEPVVAALDEPHTGAADEQLEAALKEALAIIANDHVEATPHEVPADAVEERVVSELVQPETVAVDDAVDTEPEEILAEAEPDEILAEAEPEEILAPAAHDETDAVQDEPLVLAIDDAADVLPDEPQAVVADEHADVAPTEALVDADFSDAHAEQIGADLPAHAMTPEPAEPVAAIAVSTPAPEALTLADTALVLPTTLSDPDNLPEVLAIANTFGDDLDADLLPVFLEEGTDLLPQIGQALRNWQHTPGDTSYAHTLLRTLHTVKGSARMAGAMRLGQHAHEIETQIENMLHAGSATPSAFDELMANYDHALLLFEQLQAPAVAAPVAAPLPGLRLPEKSVDEAHANAAKTPLVRVRADILDRLVNQAGEISIARSKLENQVDNLKSSLSDFSENLGRLRRQLREVEMQAESQIASRMAISSEREFDPLEFDRFTRLQELTRMMAESVNDVASFHESLTRTVDDANGDLSQQARMTRDLQRDLMRVRMVPFASIGERLFKVARQAAKETDKRVNLDIRGGGVEIDRSVLEQMAAPFEHLLRNAIVHGVEARTVRLAHGKSEIGELLVQVSQQGNEVVIEFSDDGAGLDLARIRAKAHASGLLLPGQDLSDALAADLIFEPGLSTADELTELAGRGVGMDVVRSEAQALGGHVAISTEAGKGARFNIHLPLTLAVTQVVLVNSGGRIHALPSILVEQVLQMKEALVIQAQAQGSVQYQGQAVTMHYLPALLGDAEARPQTQRSCPVLILKNGADRLALHVDEVVGNREVVVKNIGPQLSRMIGIAGATVLGSGDIVLILNPVALAHHIAYSADRPATGVAPVREVRTLRPRENVIMVVDDSLTVRRVTQRLLEREGYQVLLAKDGVDALEQLQGVVPDLMLVDIEMPRMDGFDLTRNVRGDERTRAVPIIMITSRTADKHRNYALDLGVNAYFGKPFQETVLLAAIAGLLQLEVPVA